MYYILHAGCKLCKNGGIENYIMNLYKQIDKKKYQFIFVIESKDKESYEILINSLGGKVYYVKGENIFERIKSKYLLFKNLHFDIVHIHVSCGIRAVDGILVKLAKRKCKIIFHSHSNIGKRPLKYFLLIPLYRNISSKLLACSVEAGRYFFGKHVDACKKFQVVKNAIDAVNFTFEEKKRIKIRDINKIPADATVIGFVGRLSSEKNIPLFINIINNLSQNYNKNLYGLIVGDGPEYNNLLRMIKNQNIENIIFAGNQSNVNEYMCAFDCLILPSLHEGLGIVLIEAQASSLLCFASDSVPNDTQITDRIYYFNINSNIEDITKIIKFHLINDNNNRISQLTNIKNSGYDVRSSVDIMQKIYDGLLEG